MKKPNSVIVYGYNKYLLEQSTQQIGSTSVVSSCCKTRRVALYVETHLQYNLIPYRPVNFVSNFCFFCKKNDPSQTVANERIATKICQGQPPHLAHIIPDFIHIGSLRRSYCRTREDRFCPMEYHGLYGSIIKTKTGFSFTLL